MEEKLVTLAILTYSKAQILKSVLENEGVESYIHNVNLIQPVISSGVRVRIKESDLPRALKVIESSSWLSNEILEEEKEGTCGAADIPEVLVPVDFSNYSQKACDFAFNLAARMGARITLLHVYFTPIFLPNLQFDTENYHVLSPTDAANVRNIIENVHVQLNNLSKQVDQKIKDGVYPDVKYTCVLREGIPEEEILGYSRQQKPMIVVMGTGGHQKDLELIGSVTAEVIERSPSFVYAIPEQAPDKPLDAIRKIAMFTSFDQRDLIAFDSLITTFRESRFEISFIHINSHKEKRTWNEIKLAGIKEYFMNQYPGLSFDYASIDDDGFLVNLERFVEEKGIDVICTSNYRRNVFARLFNPSMARKMLFHSQTPLLVIK